jgi:hypothetical protein
MARGYCSRCYETVFYHENYEREHEKRKLKRLRAPDTQTAKEYEQQKAWKAANRERALAGQAAWYQRNKARINRWPVGLRVWVPYLGIWCEGTIVASLNNLVRVVKLKGGTILGMGAANKCLMRREKPDWACPVPAMSQTHRRTQREVEEWLASLPGGIEVAA